MQAEHAVRMRGGHGDLVRVQVARIGRQDRVGPKNLVEPTEEIDLDVEIVEDGFDHEVAGREILLAGRHRKPRLLRLEFAPVDPARRKAALQKTDDAIVATCRGVLVTVEPDDAVTGGEGTDRDAAAHQAETGNADRRDRAWQDGLDTLHPGGLPLGEEDVPEGCRLLTVPQFKEGRALVRKALGERSCGALDQPDGLCRRTLAAGLRQNLVPRSLDGRGLRRRDLQCAGAAGRGGGEATGAGDSRIP